MDKQPTVTIGSLVRNRAWILSHFLEHILSIDYPKNLIDCVFVVNDSRDESLDILNNFKKQYGDQYNRIVIETYNRNVPEDERTNKIRIGHIYDHLAKLRNFLMSKCRTDKLLSVDSDILVPSNILLNLLSQKKEIISSVIYNGYEIYPDQAWQYSNVMYIKNSYILNEKLTYNYEHFKTVAIKNAENSTEDKIIECDLTGAVILLDKSVYRKVKYGYSNNGEDSVFCEQAKKMGFKIYSNVGLFSRHIMTKEQLEGVIK